MTKPIDLLTKKVEEKMDLLSGVTLSNAEVRAMIELERQELFGDSKTIIASAFGKAFHGKATPEVIDLLTMASAKDLDMEQSIALGEYATLNDQISFGQIVENMTFGDGSLQKEAMEKRLYLSEKMIALGHAFEIVDSLYKDVKDFYSF